MKLGPVDNNTLPVQDWFTPWNQAKLSPEDSDVGSGGVLLLPDLPAGSAHEHLLVQMGKEGTIYLVDRDKMGGYCSTCVDIDTQIVQEINNASVGIWGSPAYWNGNVYWSSNDQGTSSNLLAFSFNAGNSGLLSTVPTSQSNEVFGFGTGTPVISANGNTNGIVWLLDNSSYGAKCCQALYAFDATDLSTMYYNSSQAAGNRDVPGGAVKFAAPVVANGKVYVGSQGQVSAYGLIIPTSTVLTSSPNPAYVTQPVTYTARVTAQSGTPTGSVTFYLNVTALATLPLNNGLASYSTSYSAGGPYLMTASYSGTPNANFGLSTSPELKEVVNNLPVPTTMTLTTSSEAIFVGQPVTLTATVSSTFGTPPNGETVAFRSGGVTLGTGSLTGGVATFTTSGLTAGEVPYVLKAVYAGDVDFKSTTATTTLAVNKYSTTTLISSTLDPSSYGQAVTITAQVTTSGPSSPTGSVTFRNGTTALGAMAVNGNVATLTTKQIPLGSNQLTATYGGNPINGTSTSAPITQNVNQAVISMTLTSTPNPSIAGKSVTLNAKLISSGALPVGSAVTFSYSSSTLGTANINGAGVASLSTTTLPQGSDQVIATYAGSNDYGPASAHLTQVVNP